MAVLKARKKPRYLEALEQRLFIKRLRLDPRTKDLPWCSVPNGGKRNPREAALLKAEGVQAGVPDWLCFVGNKRFCGLAIEFKSPTGKGRLSDAQRDWHEKLTNERWAVQVCTTAVEAWDVLAAYLEITL
jgi:hypothetical protein